MTFPDGSTLRFRGVGRDYDPTDREKALAAIHESHETAEILTGILYVDPGKPSLGDLLNLVDEPLHDLPLTRLRPSKEALDAILEAMR